MILGFILVVVDMFDINIKGKGGYVVNYYLVVDFIVVVCGII